MCDKNENELEKLLKESNDYKLMHLKLCERMLNAFGGVAYPLDFLAMGAIKRFINLINGFRTLIDNLNLECATALLRLQLDNALRFFAAFIVDDPHKFASEVMQGKHVRNLKDRNNNKMTDHYLVKEISKEYEWVKPVYDTACEFIHLSDRHIYSTANKVNIEDRTIQFALGNINVDEPIERYIETVHAFIASTKLFTIYLEGWIETKENPPGYNDKKTT